MSSIVEDPIDLNSLVHDITTPECGALVLFVGVVRNRNAGKDVVAIDYHAYPDMAVHQMDRIEDEVTRRWPDLRVRIVHRIGHLEVGEASVAIAVASPHRSEAFEASRHAIDRIKESVPIWKKEIYRDGHAWIEGS